MKDAEIKYTDNIVNYGNINDYIFNMNKANHIGKIIFIKNENEKKEILKHAIKYHYLKNIGNLKECYYKK